MWLLSVSLYIRGTYNKSRAGSFGFWTMIAVLTAMWAVSLGAPPPPNLSAIAIVNAFLFSFVVVWAYWVDRHRPARIAAS